MTREEAREKLLAFKPFSEESRLAQIEFVEFLDQHPNAAERSLEFGHFTASTWIVSRDRSATLMTLHRKRGKWIPLGGHCDGDYDFESVARREAQEESGLDSIRLLLPDPIELRRHEVPKFEDVKFHWHYDVRYLFEADGTERLKMNEQECLDLAWIPLSELRAYTNESFLIETAERAVAIAPPDNFLETFSFT